ncbi:MAG: hypothetical protein ACKOA1_12330 [Bacteroidota bacterium]
MMKISNLPSMNKVWIFISMLLLSSQISAQRYYAAFGGRAGKFNTGVTFKYFWNTDNATGVKLDGYYTKMGAGGYTIKGFAIKQVPFKIPIIQLPLDLIIGGGVHGGFFPVGDGFTRYYKRVKGGGDPIEADYYNNDVVSVGIDATIELEYQVKKIMPIAFAIDVCPFYEFINRGPEYIDFGFSIRYLFRY